MSAAADFVHYHAMQEVQLQIGEYASAFGGVLTVYLRKESDIGRDNYNSIKKKNKSTVTPITVNAFPLDQAPSDNQRSRAGIFERVDCIAWTSMLDWIGEGIEFDDINTIKSTVKLKGNTWIIKDKNTVSNLYITLGLTRE